VIYRIYSRNSERPVEPISGRLATYGRPGHAALPRRYQTGDAEDPGGLLRVFFNPCFLTQLKSSTHVLYIKMTLEERSINVPSDKSSASPKRPKRGPAVTPIQERPYKARKPVLRKEETHPKARRRDVVMFLHHHLIYDPDSWKSVNGYRKPFQREAATYFQVPISTISDWWRHDIINLEREKRSYSPQWPLLEKQLFQEFIQRRAQQEVITTGWFRRRATEIFRESVTDQSLVKLFTFSNGWWIGFKRRFNIIKRRVTKRATRQPEEFKEICGSFCKFIRRVQNNTETTPQVDHSLSKMDIDYILDSPRRRFSQRYTLNVDETPIPFNRDDGSTWDLLGAKTVSVKTHRSGWEKRQATLILYIFGDGICRLQPKLIFYGIPPPKGRIYEDEGDRYAPGIMVTYNEHAYNNEELFCDWIKKELPEAQSASRDFLLVMDVAAFHVTEDVKSQLKQRNITTALIPPGCTGLLQPLDIAINKVFKGWLREEMELYEAEEARKRKTEWSVSDKRVMTTWIVARAFERLKNNRDMISKAFLEAGITVRPDGSQDNLIRIKGIDDIDFKGWEEAGDICIQSEELVHRLCDGEELGFGPEGDFTLNTLNYALERLKLAQLQQMATLNKISVKGNKSDIRDRLVQYFTREGPKKEAITVENGLKDVIFVAS
jgi:hypothetical protein